MYISKRDQFGKISWDNIVIRIVEHIICLFQCIIFLLWYTLLFYCAYTLPFFWTKHKAIQSYLCVSKTLCYMLDGSYYLDHIHQMLHMHRMITITKNVCFVRIVVSYFFCS